jgi:hypothetical protein
LSACSPAAYHARASAIRRSRSAGSGSDCAASASAAAVPPAGVGADPGERLPVGDLRVAREVVRRRVEAARPVALDLADLRDEDVGRRVRAQQPAHADAGRRAERVGGIEARRAAARRSCMTSCP